MEGSPGSQVLILCYHAVSDSWPSVGAVETDVLERQLRYLLRKGYRPLTLSTALAYRGQERVLVVTFDDAFASVIKRGLAVLERYAVPATLFVATEYATAAAPMTWSTLGRWVGTEHEDELRCMSWEEVRRLAGLGWEIGSHTCSHPDLTTIGIEPAATELGRSLEICAAEVQRPCTSLAYPFGAYDEKVVKLARRAGYEQAVTLGDRLLGPRSRKRPLELSREGVYRTTGWPQFLAATSPLLGRFRGLRPTARSYHPERRGGQIPS
jgi:peptidoglycan/xylan/chitin deacetylase (PgdA/CDA1 family)